jgi:uridylate kinase
MLLASWPRQRVIVLKLSGKIFFSDEFLKVADLLRQVVKEKNDLKLVIVTGGGRIAREYIRWAQEFGADQATQDELGIQASRLNAFVLIRAIGTSTVSSPPRTLHEMVEELEVTSREKRIVVMGGLQPGQSTNAVASLVAEKVKASLFINATDVEGVYTKDPNKYKNARIVPEITPKHLTRILEAETMKAGAYDLMDPIALKLIERSRIKTRIVRCDVNTLRSVLIGEKSAGTSIVFSN